MKKQNEIYVSAIVCMVECSDVYIKHIQYRMASFRDHDQFWKMH